MAILLALASPELQVLGITAVAGNVPLELTQVNARKVCELAGRTDIPVFAGADRPLARDLVTAEYVHGKTGLDGPPLPDPVMPLQAGHAVDFIIDTLRAEPPGTVTLCTLGPLTNIAMAFEKAPDIVNRVAEIVAMGGGLFEGGNATPVAEFNIYVDPEAAAQVFACGRPITLMPLDVTHQCLTRANRIERFRAMGARVGEVTAGWMEFFERFDEAKYGTDGGPLHDPNVIAYLLRPDLYSGRQINVEVETESQICVGQTVADWWGVTDRARNVNYIREVDHEGFFNLLVDRLARF